MLTGRKYTPDDITRLLWKRRWHVIAPLFLCGFVGLLLARMQPELYRSEAMVQVLPQRVPDEYVRSTVTSTVEERLKMITEVIKSQTQLEQIIKEFDLYPALRDDRSLEDLVSTLRDNIVVQVAGTSPTGRRAPGPVTQFKVSFTYHERDKSIAVTERLTNMLREENARMRGSLAESTNEFLKTQLEDARRRLEAQEKKLEAFRERNAGRLPTQLQSNMQAVQSAQVALQGAVESVARDRDRKMMLERLYEDASAELAALEAAPPPPSTTTPQGDPTSLSANGTAQQRLAAARATLAQLELRLTPEHPDIRRARRTVQNLEAEAAAEATTTAGTPAPARPASPEIAQRRELLRQRKAEIESVARQIEFKEAEERRLRAQMGAYQTRIDSVPGIESEWYSLSRDYETLSEQYKLLLAKSEDSKMAANLERRQIGEQFRVLDAPRVSQDATSTTRLRTNLVALGVGLLLGLGFVGLMEYRDTTFRAEGEVLAALSLPVLAAVPYAPTAAEHRREKHRRLRFSAVAASVLVISAATFWYLQLWKYVM